MIIDFNIINKEVMNRLYNANKHRQFSKQDGLVVYYALRKAIRHNLIKNHILSFGLFWLYPKKKEVFRKRNKREQALRLLER